MYESPIKIIYGQMQTQMKGDILKAVMRTDIQVDKDELIRALQYDREQYDRGFADVYMDAKQEGVHGRWIEYKSFMKCSECGSHWYYTDNHCHLFNYCPNCGAKMDGDGDA